jgi:hypothetical protein
MPRSRQGNGIMGTGIYGFFGTVVQCASTDTSFYCSLTKLVNTIAMLMFLLFLLYLVYLFFIRGFFRGKRRQ